jgi:hypothetical protein
MVHVVPYKFREEVSDFLAYVLKKGDVEEGRDERI